MTENTSKLKQSMSLWTATFYGLGTILWAWIYVLVGKVAWFSWMLTPFAFIIAAILAVFSAFSYAELSSRYPRSAWAALYVFEWFKSVWLSRIVGFLVFMSWLISAWVLANGFGAYFTVFVPDVAQRVPALWILLLLGTIAFIWINLSSFLVTAITILEVGWLLFIIRVARGGFAMLPDVAMDMLPTFTGGAWSAVILGSFLAFYAFIGFEDLANVAEEMKNPKKDMPKAIIMIMILSTLLYLLVALVAVLGLPMAELTASEKPLAVLYEHITWKPAIIISLISLFSIMNGVLVQIIMASRLMYGMADNGWIPKWLAYVSPKTQVPVISTGIVLAVMILVTMTGTLQSLASLTSFIILTIFSFINLGLCLIKYRESKLPPEEVDTNHFTIPFWIPLLGLLVNVFFIGYNLFTM